MGIYCSTIESEHFMRNIQELWNTLQGRNSLLKEYVKYVKHKPVYIQF